MLSSVRLPYFLSQPWSSQNKTNKPGPSALPARCYYDLAKIRPGVHNRQFLENLVLRKRIEPADPWKWGLQRDSMQNGELQLPPPVLSTESGLILIPNTWGSRHYIVSFQLGIQQTKLGARVYHSKIDWQQPRNVTVHWKFDLIGYGFGLRQNDLPANPNLPERKANQIRGTNAKRMECKPRGAY